MQAPSEATLWEAFLNVRHKLIVIGVDQGRTFLDIRNQLSLHDASHAERIYEAGYTPPRVRGKRGLI